MEDNKDFPIVYDGRDFNRTPMQWDDTVSAGFSTNSTTWLPVHANYRTLNVKAQKEAATSHFAVYKTLSTLRNEDTFIYGGYHPQTIGGDVFAFVR
jgi:alpha-glucosidase